MSDVLFRSARQCSGLGCPVQLTHELFQRSDRASRLAPLLILCSWCQISLERSVHTIHPVSIVARPHMPVSLVALMEVCRSLPEHHCRLNLLATMCLYCGCAGACNGARELSQWVMNAPLQNAHLRAGTGAMERSSLRNGLHTRQRAKRLLIARGESLCVTRALVKRVAHSLSRMQTKKTEIQMKIRNWQS